MRSWLCLAGAALLLTASGCAEKRSAEQKDSWARIGPEGRSATLYMQIESKEQDQIKQARVEGARETILQQTVTDHAEHGAQVHKLGETVPPEMSKTNPVKLIPLKAGLNGLEPGGYSIRALDMERRIAVGDTLKLYIATAKGQKIFVKARVKPLGYRSKG